MAFYSNTLCMAVALLLLGTQQATAQWDPSTGRIKPTPGVPTFDPAPWNSGYKVTFRNVPRGGAAEWSLEECFTTGFDTTPAGTVDMVRSVHDGEEPFRSNLP